MGRQIDHSEMMVIRDMGPAIPYGLHLYIHKDKTEEREREILMQIVVERVSSWGRPYRIMVWHRQSSNSE